MEKLFKQVFIKTESDLPKEAGSYIVCKTTGQVFERYSYPKINDVAIDARMWLKHILWYLLPVPESPEVEEFFNNKAKESGFDVKISNDEDQL